MREEWFPQTVEEGDLSLDLSPVRTVETAAGAIYRDGNTRGLRVGLAAPDSSTAEELATVVDGLLTLASGEADGPYTPEYVGDLLADVEVTREGASVALSVERTVDELEAMATDLGERTNGASASGSGSDGGQGRTAPVASFDWNHDADARTVTITHTAGDTLRADRLRIGGEGFVAVDGADQTAAGFWAGTTSEEDTVRAGDSVVVGAAADCRLRIVRRTPDASVTLAEYQGPDA